jgi:formate dehydrogenase maturation protein FdhE
MSCQAGPPGSVEEQRRERAYATLERQFELWADAGIIDQNSEWAILVKQLLSELKAGPPESILEAVDRLRTPEMQAAMTNALRANGLDDEDIAKGLIVFETLLTLAEQAALSFTETMESA